LTAGKPDAATEAQREQDSSRRELIQRLLGRGLVRCLKLAELEVGGRAVGVSGFGTDPPDLSGSPIGPATPVRYEALPSYCRTEPRLALIHQTLRRALHLGAFRDDEGCLAVDAFRLTNLPCWARYPGSVMQNIGSISSFCNCDCEFCFEKDTRHSALALGRAQLSLQEVDTRLRYYDAEKRTGLLPAARYSLEPFANPRLMQILQRVRAADPNEPISFTTNGAMLTEEVVATLAELRPVMLAISLNASNVEVRQRTAGDRAPNGSQVAMDSPALLRRYQIPFIGSYVPWPSKPLWDLEDTIRLVDEHDGALARVCLPSWAEWTHDEPPFETAPYWREILATIDRVRQEVSVPVHIMPHMFHLRTLRPVIQGTVKNSPAAMAGLRYGDLIVAIEGEPVHTRPETEGRLYQRVVTEEHDSTTLTIERDGKALQVAVSHCTSPEQCGYPYSVFVGARGRRTWLGELGIFLPDGLGLTDFVKLKTIVERHGGKRVLLCVSALGEEVLMEGLGLLGDEAQFLDRCDLYVHRVMPRYWGGNVMLGDLWTTGDLVEGVREWAELSDVRPDVVIVPATFLGDGGRDLLDTPHVHIGRSLDVPVELLRCSRISL